ncbi:MAG TPA: c-type cytochrome, partial [Candidatus Dormibacteraeota bacterium]|nr:c-type cytochrome [Candidatus Dormibacteraeota bacterium]
GWLYGCQGSTVTANIRGIEFQQGVWRYHPLTHRFELFCEGGGNSWGLDFDEDGELIYSTNLGEYRMLHGVQGAYYWKSFGKHGALHNPYTYGYFEHVPYAHFTGGHVTVGGTIYQGGSFPEDFRGKYIAGDLLGHTVQWHELTSWGSTFKAAYQGELLVPHDTWFASSDVTVGPNGSVYVADWFDKRTAHPDPDADWDRSNGRVYEIFHAGTELPLPEVLKAARGADEFDLRKLSSEQLVSLLNERNDWFVRKARRLLAERRDKHVVARLRKQVFESRDAHLALESFWALYVSGGFDDELALRLLAHPNASIRRWTVRLLGDENKVSGKISKALLHLAETEPDVKVRVQLACTAKRIPAADGLPLVQRIAARDLDSKDPYVPLLLWWALEHHAVSQQELTLSLFAKPQLWETKLGSETLLPRLIRRYAAEATEASFAGCSRLVESCPTEDARQKLLAGLDLGLPSRFALNGGNVGHGPGVKGAGTLVNELKKSWTPAAKDKILIRVLARLGDTAAQHRALMLAQDKAQPKELRSGMLELLGELGGGTNPTALLDNVQSAEPEQVQLAALDAIATLPDIDIQPLLHRYPGLSAPVQARMRDIFFGRRNWAAAFLVQVDSGAFPKADIPLDQLRKIALLSDNNLNKLVRKHWGNLSAGTPEEKLADVRRFNNDLRAFAGDASAGHDMFKKTCAACHKLFGEGGQIGPDLTGANRKDRDYLLLNIVDPSAVIRKEFMNFAVQTDDGRTLSGLLAEQSEDTVTLLGANGERTTLARAKIKSLEESATSLMPEGLLQTLKPQELRDLFAYLQSEPSLAKSNKP